MHTNRPRADNILLTLSNFDVSISRGGEGRANDYEIPPNLLFLRGVQGKFIHPSVEPLKQMKNKNQVRVCNIESVNRK